MVCHKIAQFNLFNYIEDLLFCAIFLAYTHQGLNFVFCSLQSSICTAFIILMEGGNKMIKIRKYEMGHIAVLCWAIKRYNFIP